MIRKDTGHDCIFKCAKTFHVLSWRVFHVHHGESVSCCSWVLCSVCGCQVPGSKVYSSPASLFISRLESKSWSNGVVPSGVLKFLTIIVLSVSPFRSMSIWSVYLGILILGAYIFRIGISCWWTELLSLYNDLVCFFYSFGLKSVFFLVYTVISASASIFMEYLFLSHFVSLKLLWVSYRPLMTGSRFSVPSNDFVPFDWKIQSVYIYIK